MANPVNGQGVVTDWLGQPDGGFVDNSNKVNIKTGPAWHVIGTGDFNGDGYADILWRNNDGTVPEWLGQANGTFIGNVANVNFVPPAGQHVVGIGDYDGDGLDDLLWQSTTGVVTQSVAEPDGSFATNSYVNIATGIQWRAQAPLVHDFYGL